MGDFANLYVGDHSFNSRKYDIPNCWLFIFNIKRRNQFTLKTNVKSVKEILKQRGIRLQDVEEIASFCSGKSKNYLARNRKKVLQESCDEDGIIGNFKFDQDLGEFAALYELLLGLEFSQPEEDIALDLTDYKGYYMEDKLGINDLFEDCKNTIVSTSLANQYVFHRVLNPDEMINPILNLISRFDEDTLIDTVLVPLLIKMNFKDVTRVPYHGPAEYGIDIGPFYNSDEFNTLNYFGIQAKAVNLHTNSRNSDGNVTHIAGQIDVALSHDFLIQDINSKVRLSKVLLITNKSITSDAKSFLNTKFKEKIKILDGFEISRLMAQYSILDYTK